MERLVMLTAEEFYRENKRKEGFEPYPPNRTLDQWVSNFAREYAKLCVTEALEAAKNKAQLVLRKYNIKGDTIEELMGQEITTEREMEYYGISANSILSAYPLTDIK